MSRWRNSEFQWSPDMNKISKNILKIFYNISILSKELVILLIYIMLCRSILRLNSIKLLLASNILVILIWLNSLYSIISSILVNIEILSFWSIELLLKMINILKVFLRKIQNLSLFLWTKILIYTEMIFFW